MRSNLLKSALSVFALAVAALFVGTLAMAAPTFSGGVAAGFGQVSIDGGGTGPGASGSTWNTQVESNLVATGKTQNGTVDYYYRLRIRGTQGDALPGGFGSSGPSSTATQTEGVFTTSGLSALRTRIGWNVTDAFRIEMGRLPSLGANGFADIQPLRTPAGFELPVNLYAFFDAGAINFSFKTGGIKVGLAISSNCDPGCDHGDAGSASVRAQNTLMPWFLGSFGAIDVALRLPQASAQASVAATGAQGGAIKIEDEFKSSATAVEVRFKTDALMVALESYAKTAKSPAAGSKDKKTTDLALALKLAMGVQVQYASDSIDTGGTAKAEQTWLSLAYLFNVDGASFGPEYRTTTYNSGVTGDKDVKGALIRFVGVVSL
jgi:hypothetical protein